MKKAIIAALGGEGQLGLAQGLPWHLPADLKHFKKLTLGHPVLMGHKTFRSLGRPLPGRRNLVLSRGRPALPAGVELHHSLDEALSSCQGEERCFVIGGAQLYQIALPVVDELYLTHVDYHGPADTFFPPFRSEQWQLLEERVAPADAANPFSCRYCHYQRSR